jgi:hypothetical protein
LVLYAHIRNSKVSPDPLTSGKILIDPYDTQLQQQLGELNWKEVIHNTQYFTTIMHNDWNNKGTRLYQEE